MKEINIAAILVKKRREKGRTQEDLAEYIGVSKASVSKWETGQSYPDITLLPQLATYYNISIDDLMGYEPQMSDADIHLLYKKLSEQFTVLSFESNLAKCRSIIKKYYSCFPLLAAIAKLIINHHMLAETEKEKAELLDEAIALYDRIRAECSDVDLVKEATIMQAVSYSFLNKPQEILDLLGETLRLDISDKPMLAQAYLLLGNEKKTKEVMQLDMYQHLTGLVGTATNYLHCCASNFTLADDLLKRILSLADLFKFRNLSPQQLILIYIHGAHMYCLHEKIDEALEMLELYTDICLHHLFPLSMHGDTLFDTVELWAKDVANLSLTPPRSEKIIAESMLNGILHNPIFDCLKDKPAFKRIEQQLTKFYESV